MTPSLDYLGALRERGTSFRILQAELKNLELPTATGWGGLNEHYSRPPANTQERAHREALVEDIYLRLLSFNSKAIFFIQVPDETVDEMADWLNKVDVTGSPYWVTYPLPLSGEELAKQPFTAFPTAVKNDGESIKLSMCAKRAFKSRESIDLEELLEGDRERLSGYEEVIGVRSGVRQAFDSIVLNFTLRRLEIYVDLCCPMRSEELIEIGIWYKSWIVSQCRIDDDVAHQLQTKNFFPAIEKLYSQRDGRIVSLGHSTGTRSIKDERMRGRTSLDLREELFHKEGLRAIGRTDAFSICKEWRKLVGPGSLAITIPGHFSMAGQPSARVSYAELHGATSKEEVEFLLSKIA